MSTIVNVSLVLSGLHPCTLETTREWPKMLCKDPMTEQQLSSISQESSFFKSAITMG